MDKKTFDLLKKSVNELDPCRYVYTGARIANMLNNENIITIIDIYRRQETLGGYSQSKTKKRGLMQYRNFGVPSLLALEKELARCELPTLKNAPTVIAYFDSLKRE